MTASYSLTGKRLHDVVVCPFPDDPERRKVKPSAAPSRGAASNGVGQLPSGTRSKRC
jgi:hypothetical protein